MTRHELTVILAQVALKETLAGNRDTILGLIRAARARVDAAADRSAPTVLVFPEGALASPPGTPRDEIVAAVETLCRAAQAQGLALLLGWLEPYHDPATGQKRLVNALWAVDAQGRVALRYRKLWDVRTDRVPGVFHVEGVPCAAAICADRWLRGVEDLPAIAGARVLFEVANNYRREWVPDLGWYGYVPRALRNGAYVVFCNTATQSAGGPKHVYPGHGHSAVIAPDGRVLAALGEEADELLVVPLDLDRATGEEARRRRTHPLFAPFWETGLHAMVGPSPDGRRPDRFAPEPVRSGYVSAEIELTLAAAQMVCSRNVGENLVRMERLIREAAARGADLVAFGELALTGARDEDVRAAMPGALHAAVNRIREAAQKAGLAVVFGAPHLEGHVITNCAYAIGADGALLTRYAQVAVEREDFFAAGTRTRAMWFWLRGVPCVVTVGGREALWNEIAELAALRGAQVHLHLAYAHSGTAQDALLRRQLWVGLASYHTLTVTVLAGADERVGGSVLWEDSRRARGSGPYPYCAVPVAEAGPGEALIVTTQPVRAHNPHLEQVAQRYNPQMRAWYEAGARAMDQA